MLYNNIKVLNKDMIHIDLQFNIKVHRVVVNKVVFKEAELVEKADIQEEYNNKFIALLQELVEDQVVV